MKKMFLILGLFLFSYSLAADETIPVFFPESGAKIEYAQEQDSLINVDNMKRANKIEKAKKEAAEKSQPKVKLDIDQINHQRALDFSTRQNNSLLPAF